MDIVLKIVVLPIFALLLSACAPQVPLVVIPARQIETRKITLGAVQRAVKKGAASADVIDVLSSPNIVASNADGSETWVYDKVITEQETVVGSNGSVSVRSTRTMMVVVKFDKNHVVDTVQYHQTSY